MSDTLIVLHTAIATVAIVLLIIVAKVDPVISLVIGTLYLGVAAGLGFADTIGTLVSGFGDIVAEVGLLIGFGVLMGSLLTAMGALQKPPQYDGWSKLANTDGEDSAIRGLHVSLAFFAASIQGWTTLRLSSSQALTPASGSPASLMSVSIWLTSSLLSEMDVRSS